MFKHIIMVSIADAHFFNIIGLANETPNPAEEAQ